MKRLIILISLGFLLLFTNKITSSEVKPGKVIVEWTTTNLNICPPGIFGKGPCQFPTLMEIIQRIWNFWLYVAPFVLTFLVILGGFYFLLITFKPDFRNKGWSYIKNAIIGYILLLVISGVFTMIRFIFGGPEF